MVYNENDLNPVKGSIGEYLYAAYLDYTYQIYCVPGEQRYGVDWIVKGESHDTNIDVKLSDKLEDFFTVTYRNKSNIRMPFLKGCLSTEIGIVTFDWQKFIENQSGELEELEFAIKVRDRLKHEYIQRDYIKAKQLIEKYTTSIVDIKTIVIRDLCKGFAEKKDGEGNSINEDIVARRVGTDFYAAAHIKWSAINSSSRRVHYDSKKIHGATTPYALTVKWPYSQNSRVKINEFGKTLEQMSIESLNWIRQQNESYKSSFKTKYHLNQEDFNILLEQIIKNKED